VLKWCGIELGCVLYAVEYRLKMFILFPEMLGFEHVLMFLALLFVHYLAAATTLLGGHRTKVIKTYAG
jgi:hypothetical protein